MTETARKFPLIKIALAILGIIVTLLIIRLYATLPEAQDGPAHLPNESESSFGDDQSPPRENLPQLAGESNSQAPNPADRVSTDRSLSEAELQAEQQAWESQHGYAYGRVDDYIALSAAELEQLVTAGDVDAMQYRASRSTLSKPQEAIDDYRLAAIHGSTYALVAIADTWRLHSSRASELPSEINVSNPYINALVYTFVAQLRGNNTAAGEKAAEIVSESNLQSETVLDACRMAKEVFAGLETERRAMGLPDFDNSPSPLGADPASFVYTCQL